MALYKRDGIGSVPGGAGPGVIEEQIHAASGMRTSQLNAVISTNLGGISPAGDPNYIGTPLASGDVASTDWGENLRTRVGQTWNGHLPVPMTPTILVYPIPAVATGVAATVQIRFRARGYDQFGNYIEEITPWVSKTTSATSMLFTVTLSKVFSVLQDLYVMTKNITNEVWPGPTTSRISIGWMTAIDPTRAAAAAFSTTDANIQFIWDTLNAGAVVTNIDQVGTWANWGLGTPLRIGPYGPNDPFASPEILGATGIGLRQKTTPTVINEVARLPARGQLSVAGAAPTTGVCVGRSMAGFQGCAEKFGFFSTDNWTTKIAGIELGGSGLRAGDIPLAQGQVGEDDMQFLALIRSTLGTRRGSNQKTSYPFG